MPEEEKFCVNCGAKIPADAKICPVCGTKQASSDTRLEEDTKQFERKMNKNKMYLYGFDIFFSKLKIFNMNEKQKAILVMGIIIIILMGLFPPWVYTHYGTYSEYSFIATPPEGRGIVKLDSSRLVLQWIVVLIAAGLGVFLTSTQNKEPRNKEPDETNKLRE